MHNKLENSAVMDNILTRCSIRAFTSDELSDEILMELVKAGLAAPWAFHDHKRHICAINGHGNVQRLAAGLNLVLKRPGYSMYSPAAAILVCTERGNDNQKLEVGCVLQNVFLRAHDLGLGSCWINQARDICDDEQVRPILRSFGVPDTHIVWGMAALGYPAAEPRTKEHCEGTFNLYH